MIQGLWKKPYPLYINLKQNFPYYTAFAFFFVLFLIIFQPFGLNRLQWPNKNFILLGLGVVALFVMSFNCIIFPRLFQKFFHEEKWTVGREILWQLWNWLLILPVLAFYWAYWFQIPLTMQYLGKFTFNVLILAIFFSPMCVLLNYNRLLRTRIAKVDEITRLLQKRNLETVDEIVEIVSETGREKLKVSSRYLLFIQSCENYANVVWKKNGKIENTLIRSTLKRLANQISHPFILRCHRSYIVNLKNVEAVSGNARDFMLHLNGYEKPIPVARHQVKQVIQALEAHTCIARK